MEVRRRFVYAEGLIARQWMYMPGASGVEWVTQAR